MDVFWGVDPSEDSLRMRRRLQRWHGGSDHRRASKHDDAMYCRLPASVLVRTDCRRSHLDTDSSADSVVALAQTQMRVRAWKCPVALRTGACAWPQRLSIQGRALPSAALAEGRDEDAVRACV